MADQFLRRCRSVILECRRLLSTDNVNNNTIQFVIRRLDSVRRSVQQATGTSIDANIARDVIEGLEETIGDLRANPDRAVRTDTAYTAVRIQDQENRRGAPKYVISRDQLKFMIDCGFTTRQTAIIFGVSFRTILRRLNEFGLTLSRSYSDLSDMALDEVISGVIRSNQRIGPNAVMARLIGIGVRVQRHRVRASMLRIDPEGAAIRAMRPRLHRRNYQVAGPNSLWHIDGNHKLIRWRIVIHGGIDGFSRLFVFLNAANNNRSETVLNGFIEAMSLYGCPSRVRCDLGGENNDVCNVMEVLRGGGRGSALRGTSTHNQRIERSWVDMWCGVTNLYYDLFSYLEAEGKLNVDDEVQVWALHYIYLPRINRDLRLFCGQWNHHKLRTEHFSSPLQLFVGNILLLQGRQLTAIRDLFGQPDAREVQLPAGMDLDNLVEVPQTNGSLNEQQLEQLRERVDPLDDTTDQLGISLYTQTMDFIASCA